MPQIHRRKGKRNSAPPSTPIVVFVYGVRIEGQVCDTADGGLGILLPPETGLKEKQQVRILFKGERRMAIVTSARTAPDGEGDLVGLKFR